MILEAESQFGSATSSRSSEVLHAGIDYPSGSARAQLCVQGRALLYAFCAAHGVAHQRCGKLIVATSAEEIRPLQRVQAQAQANGVAGLQWLISAAQAQALEPALACQAALLVARSPVLGGQALGLAPAQVPAPFYAQGAYFSLSGRAPFSRLIPPAGGLGLGRPAQSRA